MFSLLNFIAFYFADLAPCQKQNILKKELTVIISMHNQILMPKSFPKFRDRYKISQWDDNI